MNQVADLVRQARAHGARFEVEGDRVKVRAPAPLPTHLRDMLRARKSDVLEYLKRESTSESLIHTNDIYTKHDELMAILLQVEAEGCVFLWSTDRGELIAVYDTPTELRSIPSGFVPLSRHQFVLEFLGKELGSGTPVGRPSTVKARGSGNKMKGKLRRSDGERRRTGRSKTHGSQGA